MRQSEKKILINNALMFALTVCGVVLVVVGGGVVDKIIGAFLVFAGLGFIK